MAGARWDLAVRRKFYYRRHGVNDFIQVLGHLVLSSAALPWAQGACSSCGRRAARMHAQRLVDSGQFEVGVYSSIMAHNLEAGLNAIMTPRQRSQLVAVLDRCGRRCGAADAGARAATPLSLPCCRDLRRLPAC